MDKSILQVFTVPTGLQAMMMSAEIARMEREMRPSNRRNYFYTQMGPHYRRDGSIPKYASKLAKVQFFKQERFSDNKPAGYYKTATPPKMPKYGMHNIRIDIPWSAWNSQPRTISFDVHDGRFVNIRILKNASGRIKRDRKLESSMTEEQWALLIRHMGSQLSARAEGTGG